MASVKNICGPQVLKVRRECGLTQLEVANACSNGVSRFSRVVIAKIEAGIRCVTDIELVMLAQTLEVPVASLLSSWLSDLAGGK